MQFVCKFALENARNSVLELHKCKNFANQSHKILRHPLPKRQMLRYVPDGCISKPISVLRHH